MPCVASSAPLSRAVCHVLCVTEPAPLSRGDLDAMRRSLRTPSFRSSASPPASVTGGSDVEVKTTHRGDWSSFDVEVFVSVGVGGWI